MNVSIIIPSYNAAETIADTLESVLAQTYQNWEAIVVDDGSSDATNEITKGFVKWDARIRMISQPNGGESAARNSGIALARYDWLLFLDADDWILPLYLERMTEALLADPSLDAVHCGSARVALDGALVVEKYLPPSGDLFYTLARRAAFPIHACVVRRSLVQAVGNFDTSLRTSPDWDLWQRIARTGARFGAVREVLALYRMRPNSASLDAYQLLKDDLRVLKQGHSPDPRVPSPHPDHANGRPQEQMLSQKFYLLCWCAGLLLGRAKDARPLLETIKEDSYAELDADAVAQCIFEAATLPSCRPPHAWEELWPSIRQHIDEFLVALEKQAMAPDLARRALATLGKMILKNSPSWQPIMEALEQAQALLEEQQQRRMRELLRSPEQRVGDLALNRLRLRIAVRLWAATRHRLTLMRLAAERRWLGNGNKRRRVLATVCTDFPIYSQTFVYQELTQLARQGLEVRLVYSKLKPRDHLHPQFTHLWKGKCRLFLHRKIHEQDFARYHTRMPEKVERLIRKLREASGLSRQDLLHHDNFLQAFSFTRMVEAYRPHYLHSYFFYDRSLMALVAAYLLGLPRGISCYTDHLLKDYELKVVPLHLELCEVVIATSERIKRELLEIAPRADANRILVKPNGIDTGAFPIIERSEPVQGEPFRLVSVCRIEPKKGLLDLVEAVHLLRQRGLRVEAHLVGVADEWSDASRDYKRKLDQRISELDLWGAVHLEGRQDFEGVLRFLDRAHLFVAPFVETESGDKDGIPTAVLEAMATGLPTVATDAGSITEVIDDGQDGLLVSQRNPIALANAINELLRDPERRQRLGSEAAGKVRRRFDVRVCETIFHQRVRAILGVH